MGGRYTGDFTRTVKEAAMVARIAIQHWDDPCFLDVERAARQHVEARERGERAKRSDFRPHPKRGVIVDRLAQVAWAMIRAHRQVGDWPSGIPEEEDEWPPQL